MWTEEGFESSTMSGRVGKGEEGWVGGGIRERGMSIRGMRGRGNEGEWGLRKDEWEGVRIEGWVGGGEGKKCEGVKEG